MEITHDIVKATKTIEEISRRNAQVNDQATALLQLADLCSKKVVDYFQA